MQLFNPYGNLYIYIIVLIVNLSSFTAGNLTGWSSSVTEKLSTLEDNPLDEILSSDQLSWLASVPGLGSIAGFILYGFIMERFGRKISILLITLPAIICQLILIFLPDLSWYYTARAIGGFSQAGTYVVLPIYTAEISPSKIRGFLSISGITALLSGMLFSYSIGPYVSLTTFNIILLVPPAILIVGTILLIVPI